MASDLSDQGNNDQALRLLSQLCEQQKISMQETQAAQQNVREAHDLVQFSLF